jgi:thiol-disulfide isomerase/thioredoxin
MMGFGALAVLYVVFAASSKPDERAGLARLAVGEMRALSVLADAPAQPAEVLRDAAGGQTRLAGFRGEVLVVNLWATWCAPCVEEMPTLGALQRQFAGRLHVVAVSVDSLAEAEKARAQLERLSEGSLDFLIEPSRGILFSARAAGMPTTIIYDREGRELARLSGGADWSSPEAAALMEAVLVS